MTDVKQVKKASKKATDLVTKMTKEKVETISRLKVDIMFLQSKTEQFKVSQEEYDRFLGLNEKKDRTDEETAEMKPIEDKMKVLQSLQQQITECVQSIGTIEEYKAMLKDRKVDVCLAIDAK